MSHLIWFRTDLRVADHEALFQAVSAAKQQKQHCHAVFFWSEDQWRSHGAGDAKIAATLDAVTELNHSLAKLGIDFHVLTVDTWEDCSRELQSLCQKHAISDIYMHTEPGWNELERDQQVAQQLTDNVQIHRYHDLYFLDPEHHLTQQHQVYKVFTAYKKSLLRQFSIDHLAVFPPSKAGKPLKPKPLHVKTTAEWKNTLQLPTTEASAIERLDEFCDCVSRYADDRDIPSLDATSRLSVALSLGCISSRQIAHALHKKGIQLASDTYFSEIIWRDYYKYLLFHTPDLCLGRAYNKKWDQFPWQNNPSELERWQQGKTGVPIVDAAMRQLNTTGWMHNRLRMVAAMYLVKILQLDWRLGEAWFADKLADFDFAANNGGWQWVASTGVDAVPYFRIFNPYQQTKRFDPQGRFIRTYLPELQDIEARFFQKQPSSTLSSSYPAPKTDYAEARRDTLEKFKRIG